MAHFLRGKQAGVPGALSEGIAPELFLVDDVRSYILESTSTALIDSVSLHSMPVMALTPKSPPSHTTLSNPFLQLARANHSSAQASSTSLGRSECVIPSTHLGGPPYDSCSSVRTDSLCWTARTMFPSSAWKPGSLLRAMHLLDMLWPLCQIQVWTMS